MKVKDILKLKGPQVFTIGSEKTIAEAIEMMVNNNIGSLLVLSSEGKISGILSERDILRLSHHQAENYREIKVGDAMTKKVIIAEPDDEIDYIEQVMTQNRIRHLPIVQDKVLVGLISIGDIIKSLLGKVRADNKYLYDYISGNI